MPPRPFIGVKQTGHSSRGHVRPPPESTAPRQAATDSLLHPRDEQWLLENRSRIATLKSSHGAETHRHVINRGDDRWDEYYGKQSVPVAYDHNNGGLTTSQSVDSASSYTSEDEYSRSHSSTMSSDMSSSSSSVSYNSNTKRDVAYRQQPQRGEPKNKQFDLSRLYQHGTAIRPRQQPMPSEDHPKTLDAMHKNVKQGVPRKSETAVTPTTRPAPVSWTIDPPHKSSQRPDDAPSHIHQQPVRRSPHPKSSAASGNRSPISPVLAVKTEVQQSEPEALSLGELTAVLKQLVTAQIVQQQNQQQQPHSGTRVAANAAVAPSSVTAGSASQALQEPPVSVSAPGPVSTAAQSAKKRKKHLPLDNIVEDKDGYFTYIVPQRRSNSSCRIRTSTSPPSAATPRFDTSPTAPRLAGVTTSVMSPGPRSPLSPLRPQSPFASSTGRIVNIGDAALSGDGERGQLATLPLVQLQKLIAALESQHVRVIYRLVLPAQPAPPLPHSVHPSSVQLSPAASPTRCVPPTAEDIQLARAASQLRRSKAAQHASPTNVDSPATPSRSPLVPVGDGKPSTDTSNIPALAPLDAHITQPSSLSVATSASAPLDSADDVQRAAERNTETAFATVIENTIFGPHVTSRTTSYAESRTLSSSFTEAPGNASEMVEPVATNAIRSGRPADESIPPPRRLSSPFRRPPPKDGTSRSDSVVSSAAHGAESVATQTSTPAQPPLRLPITQAPPAAIPNQRVSFVQRSVSPVSSIRRPITPPAATRTVAAPPTLLPSSQRSSSVVVVPVSPSTTSRDMTRGESLSPVRPPPRSRAVRPE